MLFLSGETDGVSSSSDVLFLSGDTHLWGFVFLKRGMVERREAAVSTSFPPCQFWHVAIRLHTGGGQSKLLLRLQACRVNWLRWTQV